MNPGHLSQGFCVGVGDGESARFTLTGMATIKARKNIASVGKDMEKLEP